MSVGPGFVIARNVTAACAFDLVESPLVVDDTVVHLSVFTGRENETEQGIAKLPKGPGCRSESQLWVWGDARRPAVGRKKMSGLPFGGSLFLERTSVGGGFAQSLGYPFWRTQTH